MAAALHDSAMIEHEHLVGVANRAEALRDDEHFAYVAAWEYTGVNGQPLLYKEPLAFEYVKLSQRSYK